MQTPNVHIMLRQYGFVTGSVKQCVMAESIRCYHLLQMTHGIT
jgi:hypothetical protein